MHTSDTSSREREGNPHLPALLFSHPHYQIRLLVSPQDATRPEEHESSDAYGSRMLRLW